MGSRVTQFRKRRFERPSPSWSVALLRGFTRVAYCSCLAAPVLSGCAPKLSAGEWQCSNEGGAADDGTSQASLPTDAVTVPWSTGFELADSQAQPAGLEQPALANFCGYLRVGGYCYGDVPYALVTEPHHSGRFAAEFKVIGSQQHQTRCVRQGNLPESAYYGAWYFIPEPLTRVDVVWNLWHYQGRDSLDEKWHDLWDVTLVKGAQPGDWELIVYDRLAPPNANTYRSADHKTVPFGSWFHIELFLKRASDGTGRITLYQDGAQLFDKTNLNSAASKIMQWYVGDLADTATPADSVLYVDDVSISATPSANASQ